jgi:hypothetical protein
MGREENHSMSENKKLLWWIGSIFSASCLLIVGVIAHDRGLDTAIIDHVFDFHLDPDSVRSDIEADKFKRDVQARVQAENDKRREEWASEVREWWRDGNGSNDDSDRGTVDRPGDSRD